MNIVKITCCVILLAVTSSLRGQEIRTYDGFGNNPINPEWGAAESSLIPLTTTSFEDGISTPAGSNRMNPREVSNILFDQVEIINDKLALSDYVWVFGQFIDHDISLVENFNSVTHPEESAIIFPPIGDPFFNQGDFIPMMRSIAAPGTGTDVTNPRRYNNAITSFIDGSMVYGSSEDRANWLRTFQNGKLKTSNGNNLPWNTSDGEFNSPIIETPHMETSGSLTKFYVAGDERANENPLLISMHTMFVREHNLICDELKAEDDSLNDEEIYQYARKIVSGKIQAIVYKEWLPSMNIIIPDYTGYKQQVNPSVSNVFSAAAFRLGHTLINSTIIRMKNNGDIISRGNLTLKEAFFNPLAIDLAGGIDPYIKGMGTQIQQDFDCKVVGDIRNFLFGEPGQGGLDLAAININRGRERGLPDYNTVRSDFGLPAINEFSDLCDNEVVSALLQEVYQDINDVDPWVGMLAEIHQKDALFGELVMTIMEKQFRNLRDGDRFYYENDTSISPEWLNVISNTTMQQIVMRNTSINVMQPDVFRAMNHEDIPNGPDIQSIDLSSIIFPNPVKDHFYLKTFSSFDQEVKLTIYDQTGNPVYKEGFDLDKGDNNLLVNIGIDFPTGLYYCHIVSEENSFVTKILKE